MRQVQSWGMVSEETADPLEALAWIRAGKKYDVGLLDMQMPEMDGISLAREIQSESPDKADLPLLMLTSLGIRDINSNTAKIFEYLTKPIKPAVLYSALLNVFGAHTNEVNRIKDKNEISVGIAPFPPLRILLAEDTIVNQKVALLLLQRIGCRADVAGDGLEVLAALERQNYDIILMDVQMPEMDGLEATRKIRAGSWLKEKNNSTFSSQPYIIAMTANAMQGDRGICLSAGMDDYVSKPVRIDELTQALQRAVNAKNASSQAPVSKSSENNNDDVIDDVSFQKFKNSLGEEGQGILFGLIDDFIAEGSQQVEEIQIAGKIGAADRVCRAAHSLKSSSQMFGAFKLAQICKEVETQSRKGQLDRIEETSNTIKKEFEAVRNNLINRNRD
jgi:CheY-like chemotaxis protein/HPt (histidine-containing phosphotransfer) domain-containing protein